MATATVTGTLRDPSGVAPVDGRVEAILFPTQAAFDPTGGEVVPRQVAHADPTTGIWTLVLERNDTMTPSGLVYQVVRTSLVGGLRRSDFIRVAGSGRFEDMLTVAPTAVPPAGVVVAVLAGAGTVVDSTDPQRPRISTVGGAATLPAATALSAHRAVVEQADGTLVYADPSNPAHLQLPVWVTLTAAGLPGDQVQIQTAGSITEPTWAWTPGGPVFVGAAGVLTQTYPGTPGRWVRIIGTALNATTLYVNPQEPIAV